jgi:hypothetical protein
LSIAEPLDPGHPPGRAGTFDNPVKGLTDVEPMTNAMSACKVFDRQNTGWVKVELRPAAAKSTVNEAPENVRPAKRIDNAKTMPAAEGFSIVPRARSEIANHAAQVSEIRRGL